MLARNAGAVTQRVDASVVVRIGQLGARNLPDSFCTAVAIAHRSQPIAQILMSLSCSPVLFARATRPVSGFPGGLGVRCESWSNSRTDTARMAYGGRAAKTSSEIGGREHYRMHDRSVTGTNVHRR
jgi:hypothetical protein